MAIERRDYIMRMIEELRQFFTAILQLRTSGHPDEALSAVLRAQERLSALPPGQFSALGPAEQFDALTRGETPDTALAKCLLQADLLIETGRIYEAKDQAALALGAFNFARQFLEMTGARFPDTPEAEIRPRLAEMDGRRQAKAGGAHRRDSGSPQSDVQKSRPAQRPAGGQTSNADGQSTS